MKYLLLFLPYIFINCGISTKNLQGPENVGSHTAVNSGTISYTDTLRQIVRITPFNLEIAPPSSGVQFHKNEIIFLSYSKSTEKMSRKHLSFGSLLAYKAEVSDTVPGQMAQFLPASMSVFPVESMTFSGDYNTMYLSRIRDKDKEEKIFRARLSASEWVIDSEPANFCSEEAIYTHPVLSGDGSFMIFSSNKTGSLGGVDLFITRKSGERWTSPESLGNLINTSGNELYASLDDLNNLYFSSDGLPGYGGYDIFMCRYNGKTWGSPKNMTSTFNTENDEIAFTYNRNNNLSAFFTSRTRNGETRLFRVQPLISGNATTAGSLSKSFLALTGQGGVTQEKQLAVADRPTSQDTKPGAIAEEKKVAESKPADSKPVEAKQVEIKPVEKAPEVKTPVSETVKRETVTYRVQLATSAKPSGSKKITVGGVAFNSYEYFYSGAYRTTIGEFTTLTEASKLQKQCRSGGFSQAFVVAFANDVRITDAEAKLIEARADQNVTAAEKTVAETQVQNKPAETKPVETKTVESKPAQVTPSTTEEKKDIVIYRVQILANPKSVGNYNITVANQSYKTFEYNYAGSYRTTVGEFSTLAEATKFQAQCRQAGYSQAFVVAFKNGVRSTDAALFKK